jgi:hypothetical protein
MKDFKYIIIYLVVSSRAESLNIIKKIPSESCGVCVLQESPHICSKCRH